MISHDVKHIMRTSDRRTFKACRRKWDILSPMRQNREPVAKPMYLDFGTAFHKGLEVYYDPTTWTIPRRQIAPIAVGAFVQEMKDIRQKAINLSGMTPTDEQDEVYDTHLNLGVKMFEYYFNTYAPKHDMFTPTHTEVEFEVPIFVYIWDEASLAYINSGIQAKCPTCYAPLWYQGRIDMIVMDRNGNYWIWDHKTAGQMGNLAFLDTDEQITSYCWAIRHQLNIDVKGFYYAQFLKDYPEPPEELKSTRLGRNFSVKKGMRTTYDLYLKTITEAGEDISLYADMLESLRATEDPALNPFIRRSQQVRNWHELAESGKNIYLESQEYFNHDIPVFPSASMQNCNGCWTREVCIGMNQGADWQYTLETMFKTRERKEV